MNCDCHHAHTKLTNILITGATGAVGRFVTQALLAEGHNLRLLVRSSQPPAPSPQFTTHHGDLSQPQTLKNACEGIDIVIHLAAKLHINDPSADLYTQYHQTNVVGTQCLVEDALRHKVQRFVFASTINVYGSSDGRAPFTEESSLKPDSIYAETKISAENAVRAQIPHTILRLAAVYGRQMNGNYPRLVRAIGKRRFAYIGDGNNRRALIHERDVASAISHVIATPTASNQTFNLTDNQPHRLRDIVNAIAAAQAVSPPSIHLPAKPLRLALGAIEDTISAFGRRSPLTRAIVDKMTEDMAVNSCKIQMVTGFEPQIDLQHGWSDACQG